VRELKNLVERVLIMVAGAEVRVDDLGLTGVADSPVPADRIVPLREARERFEHDYMSRVVASCGGNMSEAARLLGVDRSHLYRKLRAVRHRMR
jgi:two-component system nitrogen regulation response regulator NtrX